MTTHSPESAPEPEITVQLTGEAAEYLRAEAERYGMTTDEIVLGFVSIGKTVLDNLRDGYDLAGIKEQALRKPATKVYDLATAAMYNPCLHPFGDAQHKLHRP
jgi:hypothetical protein